MKVDDGDLDLLTNAHTGYVRDANGVLRCWTIWHRPQTIQTAAVDRAVVADPPNLEAGGPDSALYVRSVDYEVYLPARVVS